MLAGPTNADGANLIIGVIDPPIGATELAGPSTAGHTNLRIGVLDPP
jgi:hypothetical protein